MGFHWLFIKRHIDTNNKSLISFEDLPLFRTFRYLYDMIRPISDTGSGADAMLGGVVQCCMVLSLPIAIPVAIIWDVLHMVFLPARLINYSCKCT